MGKTSPRRRARNASATGLITLAALTAVPGGGGAVADTDPPAGTPATVSVDALPTWQINGVVWSMVTVGNTVYATGRFTRARPPGTAAGSPQEVVRNNILAFDITTGNLITSFNHSLNGQGLRIVASPDGSRVYVGGEFTTVDGQPRNRLAAFNTATGALDPGFKPSVSAVVRAIAATNTTVYFGGNFFNVNGSARTRLAAVQASNGANINTWKPTADDDEVFAMAMAPSHTRVIIGGRFQKINGVRKIGVGAVNATTGASATWTSTPIPARIGSQYSYPTDFMVTGGVLYASANGEGGHWFDGRFAANAENGDLIWLDNCYGASYGVYTAGQVTYSVSHAHECKSLSAFPEVTSRRALATTSYATGIDPAPSGSNSTYFRQPVPTLLHYFPVLGIGTFTGQYQSAWAVTGTGDYVAMGGEFPSQNGQPQQGLIRFAKRAVAPNKIGPENVTGFNPTATKLTSNSVRIGWKRTWDQDNNQIKYEVLRSGTGAPVNTRTLPSNFWTLPSETFTDTSIPNGTYTYRIRATDPLGNSRTSAPTSPITIGSGTPSALATDDFNRTVTGGLGSADIGGAWSPQGPGGDFAVNGSAAKVTFPAAGSGRGATLGISSLNTDVTMTLASDKVGTSNGMFWYGIARNVSGAGSYLGRVRLMPGGEVRLLLSRANAAQAETVITAEQVVSGVTYAPGTVLRLRVQALGGSPTTVRAKVWVNGSPEPAGWTQTVTDSTAGLQVAGGTGFRGYLSGGATNAPYVMTVDEFRTATATP